MRKLILAAFTILAVGSIAAGQVSPEEALRRLKERQQQREKAAASQPSPAKHTDVSQPSAPSTQPAAWAKLPPARWPQVVLTNEASFDGHSSLEGASSFLVKMPDGEVLLGTAKHL